MRKAAGGKGWAAGWAACVWIVGAWAAPAQGGQYELPGKGIVAAEAARMDDDGATFKTQAGAETYGWWELPWETAHRVGSETGLFRLLDVRGGASGARKWERAIVSRTRSGEKTRYYAAFRESAPKSSSRGHMDFAFVDAPPRFVDDRTILAVSNYWLVCWRDYDGDGKEEQASVCRHLPKMRGETWFDDDPEGMQVHRWRTTIEAGGSVREFIVLSRRLPGPPEPGAEGSGRIRMGGREFGAEELDSLEGPDGKRHREMREIDLEGD